MAITRLALLALNIGVLFVATTVSQKLPPHLTDTSTSAPGANRNFNLLRNGGFERPGLMNGLIGVTVTKTMSRAQMPQDWDLIDGSIMYASEKMWASGVDGGKFSIGMTGQYQGGTVLSHNVTIHPDEFYVLAFDMAADPEDAEPTARLHVSIMTQSQEAIVARNVSVDGFGTSRRSLHWRTHVLPFSTPSATSMAEVATTASDSTSCTVTLTSMSLGISGPILDNVRLFRTDALPFFYHSPNTLYHSHTLLSLPASTSLEHCARSCMSHSACAGFLVESSTANNQTAQQCHLKSAMLRPHPSRNNAHQAYILRATECSFGGALPGRPCPHVIPVQRLVPLVCVSTLPKRRSASQAYEGECRPLTAGKLCPLSNGFFPTGSFNISATDHPRVCDCTEDDKGAIMECTRVERNGSKHTTVRRRRMMVDEESVGSKEERRGYADM